MGVANTIVKKLLQEGVIAKAASKKMAKTEVAKRALAKESLNIGTPKPSKPIKAGSKKSTKPKGYKENKKLLSAGMKEKERKDILSRPATYSGNKVKTYSFGEKRSEKSQAIIDKLVKKGTSLRVELRSFGRDSEYSRQRGIIRRAISDNEAQLTAMQRKK